MIEQRLTLAQIAESVAGDMPVISTPRRRGGLVQGVHWAEVSGRMQDGSWLELRMRATTATKLVQATLMAYQPLTQGGRTVVVGEWSASYDTSFAEHRESITVEVRRWFRLLTSGGE